MIKKFENFINESSTDWKSYEDSFKKINDDIMYLKKQIKSKETELEKLNTLYGNKGFSDESELIKELEKEGIKEFYTSPNEFVGNPYTSLPENTYFEFINPNGVRIGVTFEYGYVGWSIYANVVMGSDEVVLISSIKNSNITAMDLVKKRGLINKMLSINSSWVKRNKK